MDIYNKMNKSYKVVCVDNKVSVPFSSQGLTANDQEYKLEYSLEIGKVYTAYPFTNSDCYITGHVPTWEILNIYPKKLFKCVDEIRDDRLNSILS